MRNLLFGRPLTVAPAIDSGSISGELIDTGTFGARSTRILTDGVIAPPDLLLTHGYAIWDGAEDETVALTADLGAATACGLLRIWGAHNFGTTARPKAILVEQSDNGSDWTEVLDLSGLTSPGVGAVLTGWLLEADLSSAGSHRYWRATLTHQAQFLRVTEMQITDEGEAPPDPPDPPDPPSPGDDENRMGGEAAIRKPPRMTR